VYPGVVRIVCLAVVPNKLQIIEHFLNTSRSLLFETFKSSTEVHGVLDDIRVIGESHALPVNRFPEVERIIRLAETVDDDLQLSHFLLAYLGG